MRQRNRTAINFCIFSQNVFRGAAVENFPSWHTVCSLSRSGCLCRRLYPQTGQSHTLQCSTMYKQPHQTCPAVASARTAMCNAASLCLCRKARHEHACNLMPARGEGRGERGRGLTNGSQAGGSQSHCWQSKPWPGASTVYPCYEARCLWEGQPWRSELHTAVVRTHTAGRRCPQHQAINCRSALAITACP